MSETNVALLKPELSWLQRHERLIIVALILISLVWGLDRVLNHFESSDRQDATSASIQYQQQKEDTATIASQVRATYEQYQATIVSTTQQNAALVQAVLKRSQALTVVQTADVKLPPQDLAKRWLTLIDSDGDSVLNTQAGIQVTPAGAIATVTKLEELPVVIQNLTDTQTQADNDRKELNNANALLSQENQEITSLNTQIVDGTKACTAEVNLVKATARKSKLKWFGVGYVAGFISGLIAKP